MTLIATFQWRHRGCWRVSKGHCSMAWLDGQGGDSRKRKGAED